jgi:hypothetical protein
MSGTEWSQNAFAAIGFIKTTDRDIAEKASIPQQMFLKSLAILEIASISLKKSSKIIEIFIKTLHF